MPDYIGPNCDVFCTDETTENCTCPPGFTGLFCDTDIDDCVGVDCGENQRCVDDLLNYTCVCEPGFTGPDCLTNIDNCALVNCNSGTCVDGVNFHICLCPPRFTGPSCETELDSYVLQFIIHSFSNPNGSCADVHCFDVEEQICCEENGCPSACDYYFSLCLREEVKFVSRMGENNLGGCPNIYTPAERVNEGAAFGQAIFGIETQFNFTGRVWVSAIRHNCCAVIKYRLHTKSEVAKSLGNQAQDVQPACTMTTHNSKIRLISSIALKLRLIPYSWKFSRDLLYFKNFMVQTKFVKYKTLKYF